MEFTNAADKRIYRVGQKKKAVVDDKNVIVIMIKKIGKWHENKNAELFD
jgi:hypothetical protein